MELFAAIGSRPRLEHFCLSRLAVGNNNEEPKLRDAHIVRLSGLNYMRQLELRGIASAPDGWGVSSAAMAALVRGLGTLQELVCYEVETSDLLLSALAANTRLASLHVSGLGPSVTPSSEILARFARLPALDSLCIYCGEIEDPCHAWFKGSWMAGTQGDAALQWLPATECLQDGFRLLA